MLRRFHSILGLSTSLINERVASLISERGFAGERVRDDTLEWIDTLRWIVYTSQTIPRRILDTPQTQRTPIEEWHLTHRICVGKCND